MTVMSGLAPWWLLVAVDLTVGGLAIALAMRPRRRTTARRPV